jgi:hypothetical protein
MEAVEQFYTPPVCVKHKFIILRGTALKEIVFKLITGITLSHYGKYSPYINQTLTSQSAECLHRNIFKNSCISTSPGRSKFKTSRKSTQNCVYSWSFPFSSISSFLSSLKDEIFMLPVCVYTCVRLRLIYFHVSLSENYDFVGHSNVLLFVVLQSVLSTWQTCEY